MPAMTSLDHLVPRYRAAIIARDVEAVIDLYAEDAIYFVPGFAIDARGRDAIAHAYREYFRQVAPLDFRLLGGEYQVVGDMAYGHRAYELRYRDHTTGAEQVAQVRATEVLRKGVDGGWRLLIDHA